LPASPEERSLVPTTLYHAPHNSTFFYSVARLTPFPSTPPTNPASSIWTLDSTQHAFVDTPEFYQRLIGKYPPIDDTVGFWIAGSHGWILASTDRNILAQGAGPTDGHLPPTLLLQGGTVGGYWQSCIPPTAFVNTIRLLQGRCHITVTMKASYPMFSHTEHLASPNTFILTRIWSWRHVIS
jgi:hypothetical protein